MLRSLYIRDYALIEELEVEFGSGLNIITGETGAGKSIVLGALKLILGERASTDQLRTGAKKAVIEGIFDGDSPRVAAILAEHDIESMPSIILRREVTSSQSRAFINDTPATVAVLRELASHMIDLHGQHEHQSLLRVETHLELLDNFGGLGSLVESYRRHFDALVEKQRERKKLVAREKELQERKDLIEFQIGEIDAVDPKADEEDALEEERRILENAERLYEATAELYQLLYESDGAVYDQLVVARNELADLARIDRQFNDWHEEIKSAAIVVTEVTQALQDYNARIEFNPDRLELIRDRLGDLETLKRKYGGSLESVLEYRSEIGETYDLAADFEGAIKRLDEQIEAERRALTEAAFRLSAKRREVAERIERGIEAEIADLGIPHSTFEVRFRRTPQDDGWIGEGSERFVAHSTGMDEVEFYITTNLGEEPRPLAKVASGGEISRIMLALKSILAKSERLPILVFDEIDTGISGNIAKRVGESMKRLADYHQIIAITHLPQIAALGDVHLVVSKGVEAGRTKTHVKRLDDTDRAAHVAELFSGDATEAALKSARELIEAGRRE